MLRMPSSPRTTRTTSTESNENDDKRTPPSSPIARILSPDSEDELPPTYEDNSSFLKYSYSSSDDDESSCCEYKIVLSRETEIRVGLTV
mmetsp:Transcript_17046/g.19625  ORF Transcript_17046/g.19625 Transcript_17046/m.19625 type:complete len:89 (+) Transcript_17046:96-362(+)